MNLLFLMNIKDVKKAALKAAFKWRIKMRQKLLLDDRNQRIDGGLCIVAFGVEFHQIVVLCT